MYLEPLIPPPNKIANSSVTYSKYTSDIIHTQIVPDRML